MLKTNQPSNSVSKQPVNQPNPPYSILLSCKFVYDIQYTYRSLFGGISIYHALHCPYRFLYTYFSVY